MGAVRRGANLRQASPRVDQPVIVIEVTVSRGLAHPLDLSVPYLERAMEQATDALYANALGALGQFRRGSAAGVWRRMKGYTGKGYGPLHASLTQRVLANTGAGAMGRVGSDAFYSRFL